MILLLDTEHQIITKTEPKLPCHKEYKVLQVVSVQKLSGFIGVHQY